jgi:endonuclease G
MFRFSSTLLITFLLTLSAFGKVETTLGIPLSHNSNLAGFTPATENPEIIISREQYVLSYNKKTRIPNWAAWKLDKSKLGTSGRASSFTTDTELENYLKQADPSYRAVQPTEYTDYCFDRGHQVPSADRSDSVTDNKETFVMSNMAPQTPYLNRVMWAHLEAYTRELVQKQNKKVLIIAGPIFDRRLGSIGPNRDIEVPSKFFKVIFTLNDDQNWRQLPKGPSVTAVIMPNTDDQGNLPNLSQSAKDCSPFEMKKQDVDDWKKYQVSLQEVEKAAGIRILPSH